MKKTLFVLSLMIGASSITIAQTADEIINKNIEAMGGLAKLNSIKTIYEEDSLNAGSAKLPVKMWMVDKKAMRVEFAFSGMVGYSILRNDSGWNFVPFQGQKTPEPVTSDEVKKGQDDLFITDAFVNYKQNGFKVSYGYYSATILGNKLNISNTFLEFFMVVSIMERKTANR